MGNYDFDKDLDNEEKTTEKLIEHIESRGYKVLETNDDNKYDLKVEHCQTGEVATIEIKEDFMCQTTGNIAIEFSCRGKDSGIRTTKADFYYYIIHYDKSGKMIDVAISVEHLKKFIAEHSFTKKKGGDSGSNTMMYLIQKDHFIEECKTICKY